MMMKDLIVKTRSIRRFKEYESISIETLREFVDLGRLSASAANKQPLKYFLSNTPERNIRIFPAIGWAGYLKDWDGPQEGERPAAYIIICNDTRIQPSPLTDHGIAAQSILLGAAEHGIGGCMIGSFKKSIIAPVLQLPEYLEIVLLIALGVPAEIIVLEEIDSDGDIRYYRDGSDVHHVPKRRLDDIIIN